MSRKIENTKAVLVKYAVGIIVVPLAFFCLALTPMVAVMPMLFAVGNPTGLPLWYGVLATTSSFIIDLSLIMHYFSGSFNPKKWHFHLWEYSNEKHRVCLKCGKKQEYWKGFTADMNWEAYWSDK